MEWTTFSCKIILKMKRILLISRNNMTIQNQTQSYRRTKEHVKNVTHKSHVGPKDTITNIYQQAGEYSALCCFSDFPRNRKEICNSRYTEKAPTLKEIIEVIGFYKMEIKGSNFIQNICVAPEKNSP